jgi:hypothetical protein
MLQFQSVNHQSCNGVQAIGERCRLYIQVFDDIPCGIVLVGFGGHML